MRRASVRAWISGLFISGALSCSAALAQPVPLADFFRKPVVTSAVMSPSGRYVAASMSAGGTRQRLVVMDLQDITKSKVAAAFADGDVFNIHWVNDGRVVFSLTDQRLDASEQLGNGLFAVDREGKEAPRRLIKPFQGFVAEVPTPGDRSLSPAHALFSTLNDGSDDVVVFEQTWNNLGEPIDRRLLRLDTATGRARSITVGAPAHASAWTLDSQGVPRVMQTDERGTSQVLWKRDAASPWESVFTANSFTGVGRRFNPLFIGPNDILYAQATVSGDTPSLVRIDLHKPSDVQPLISLAGYDFRGRLILDRQGALLGAHYLTDAEGTAWFDPALKKQQAKIDAMLPATVNRLDCGLCDHPGRLLVTSWSDRQPTVYRMFDIDTGTLTLLAESRPWIKPQTMAVRDMKRFAARDGLSIPVHVTRPAGSKQPAPMVVLVHGGPYVRGGEWQWYDESQFLASRGYVVVEPEYRGSTGFGYRHFKAGWKQWGLKMQDDIADATTWAVKEGYADPKRVCIAGASYGGYATLMGLVRYPDLYRCGFEWVGVTDIGLLSSVFWSDTSEMYRTYGLPTLVGDPVADAAQLEATSPLKQADRITQPLLMAYGGVDRRVPMEHGTQLRRALEKHNPNVEWIDYPGEGHGWVLEANDIDFWTHVEKFLQKNLATAP